MEGAGQGHGLPHPAPVRRMHPRALPHSWPLCTIPSCTQGLPQGPACPRQHQQTASMGSTEWIPGSPPRGGSSPAGRGRTWQQKQPGGCSQGSTVPQGMSRARGWQGHTRVHACAQQRVRVCTPRRSVHAQPRGPNAGPQMSAPWEQQLPLPPATGRCGAVAPKAPAHPWLTAEPHGQPPPSWGAGCAGWLWSPCAWLPVFPPRKGFYAQKVKPHPSPWVLNYSINNAAGAIPGPECTAAMTWLPSPAPASLPSLQQCRELPGTTASRQRAR